MQDVADARNGQWMVYNRDKNFCVIIYDVGSPIGKDNGQETSCIYVQVKNDKTGTFWTAHPVRRTPSCTK